MATKLAQQINDEVDRLPEPLLREVLAFIGYLSYRYRLNPDVDTEAMMAAQQEAMHHVWDNIDDEIWNEVPTW
ncbi:MAG: hypothetical protein HQL58_08415 [Magnetococcales bacterium]|nr:hypothetical protein [Magnetococcales bacterium]